MRFQRTGTTSAVSVEQQIRDSESRSARVAAEVERQLGCRCSETELRYRVQSNGVKQYVRQCTDCGKWSSALRQATLGTREMAGALPLDRSLYEAYRGKRNRLWQRLYDDERAESTEQFWAHYSAYLNTPGWRAKAARVLERDGHLCQACLRAKATQVHHLTYDHVFDEFLWELAAVCTACHERLHG